MNKWRLPTIKELQEVYDYEFGEHNVRGFKKGYYWSSTLDPKSENRIYVMCFDKGWTTISMLPDVRENKRNELKFHVRCVRENDGVLEWSKANPIAITFQEALDWSKSLESAIYVEK
jgi:hypothetical protein